MFEEHGEIKTFFDLIGNRGMVFVTYVSVVPVPITPESEHDPQFAIRAAERARDRLQGSEIGGRPVGAIPCHNRQSSQSNRRSMYTILYLETITEEGAQRKIAIRYVSPECRGGAFVGNIELNHSNFRARSW